MFITFSLRYKTITHWRKAFGGNWTETISQKFSWHNFQEILWKIVSLERLGKNLCCSQFLDMSEFLGLRADWTKPNLSRRLPGNFFKSASIHLICLLLPWVLNFLYEKYCLLLSYHFPSRDVQFSSCSETLAKLLFLCLDLINKIVSYLVASLTKVAVSLTKVNSTAYLSFRTFPK